MPGSKPDLLAALAWLTDAGADEAILEAPVDRFAATGPIAMAGKPVAPAASPRLDPGDAIRFRQGPAGASPVRAGRSDAVPHSAGAAGSAPTGASASDSIGRAMEISAACNSLAELRTALEAFDGCTLKTSANNTVFADGTPHHGIMLIGEAPGREEDSAGLPFVGRAGKLLDKMLATIGLDRRSNVYITNVLNWRPPDNRDPSPDEAASCLPFLRRHIELVSPNIIVLLGAVAARHVLGRSDGIMRLRGRWLEYFVNGRMVPVMPTLHPAYLLRRAIDKRLAWRDLQEISAKVNLLELLEERSERR
jgi:uracil-DNA glycosylase family 4